ncbi:hybrid sensor histidine kinase/response regulator [Aquabacterium sp.]|uniref:hybrid sensor histidine kinase/response regulator n=1 Tax=Aquabacterium sp. TaxID=1872578 RepID=UPI002E34BA68|nr:response regulator [Aquabacterium sp.]HEX5310832.1 response regulator [Aquabacterium sp.]
MLRQRASTVTLLLAALLAVTTLLLTAFAIAFDNGERKSREALLHRALQSSLQQQVAALNLPMWDLDETHVVDIMRSGMLNREVYAIVAHSQDKHHVLVRDANWQAILSQDPPQLSGTEFLSAQADVLHDQERVGHVQVYVTPQFMREDLHQRRLQLAALIVGLDIALVLALGLLLWRLLVQPIRAIERYAAGVKDDTQPQTPEPQVWFTREFASLNQSIRSMTDMLAARYRALRDSEERLTLAARAAEIGVWEWDVQSNKLAWDEQLRLHYGWPAGCYSGSHDVWLDSLLPQERERIEQEIQSVLKGRKNWSAEFSILRPDGEIRIIKGMGASLRDESGKVVRVVGVNTDITDHRLAEDQIRQLNAELEQRVRERTAQLETANQELAKARDQAESATRAKSEFLANMSHEIRTPMNAIVGLTTLALRTDLSPKQKNYLNNVRAASDSLLEIINDILDFSKMEAGKLAIESRDFILLDVLDRLISVVALKAQERGLHFLVEIDPALLTRPLRGDPVRLGQVLINLCNNAVKFTHRGEVILRMWQGADVSPSNTQLYFEVQDSGIGMSADQMHKLFAPFSQVDASTTRLYGGTGLGLAICKQLLALMQGDIHVQSELGRGTTFSGWAQLGQAAGVTGKECPTSPDKKLAVLVVHPHEPSRAVLARQLTLLGHNPTPVATPHEAQQWLEHHQQPFDVVLLDSATSEGDPIEWVHRFRHAQADPPVRVLIGTPLADEATALRAQQETQVLTLYYPILPNTLHDALQPSQPAGAGQTTQAISAQPAAEPTAPPALKGRTVLLVEDNPINQIVATDLLGEVAGMNVIVAEDGQQALAALQRHRFDVVLMDVQMPVMDGLQATQLIRLNPAHRDLPIIAMTAHAMARDQHRCLSAGMNDYVAKPFEPQSLFDRLAKWIGVSPATDRAEAAQARQASPPQEPSDQPVEVAIDFEKGLRRCARKPHLYRKLATRFLTSRREDAEAIRAALQHGNTEAAAMIAHQQISTAGVLGADSLSAAARALQLTLLEGPSIDWPVMLESFDQQLIATLEALERHFAEQP